MDFEKLREIIADKLNIKAESITPESRFGEDLGADSLDLLNIVIEIEEKFKISVTDDKLSQIETAGDALRAINGAINE